MTEGAKNQESAEHAAASASSKKKLVLVAAAAVTILLGAGIPLGYFAFRAPAPLPEEAPAKEPELPVVQEAPVTNASEERLQEDELQEGEEALGAIAPLDTFLVNLSGGKYIRLQLQAELETPDIPRRFYARVVPMRDQIIALLTQKTAAELEELSGKEKLKTSIREIMNQQLRREDVRRIYFTQFVIQ